MGALLGYIFSDKELDNYQIQKKLDKYANGRSRRLNWDTWWQLGGPYWRADTLHMKFDANDFKSFVASESFRSNRAEHQDYTSYYECMEKGYLGVDACQMQDLLCDPLEGLGFEYVPWYIMDKNGIALSQYNRPESEVLKRYKKLMEKYSNSSTWITVVSIHF